ncbi:hypothetical protein Nepgr_010943 [Nepenthes gracilis]|uniref:Uncharacterized protein n=1 Tax=Nepenthes gracilis TaxID=150966 RepID=A0AAD3XLH5_NEPGR|nr:hypothetical protein Nepgr_010943 [Nepenthes gracilis]
MSRPPTGKENSAQLATFQYASKPTWNWNHPPVLLRFPSIVFSFVFPSNRRDEYSQTESRNLSASILPNKTGTSVEAPSAGAPS